MIVYARIEACKTLRSSKRKEAERTKSVVIICKIKKKLKGHDYNIIINMF